jgi:hypothetical protein
MKFLDFFKNRQKQETIEILAQELEALAWMKSKNSSVSFINGSVWMVVHDPVNSAIIAQGRGNNNDLVTAFNETKARYDVEEKLREKQP